MSSPVGTITGDLGGRASLLAAVVRLAADRRGEPRLFLPPLLAAFWLSLFGLVAHYVGAPPETYPFVLPIVWLAVAPTLIVYGDRSLTRFLVDVDALMSREDHSRLMDAARADLCAPWGHVLTVLMTLGFGAVGAFFAAGQAYPLPALIVLLAFLLMSGFITGLGFWGMWVSARASHHACDYQLDLNPTHADGFSGLACAGRMLLTAVALFYSGLLFVPLGLTVLRALTPGITLAVAFAIVAGYILFGVGCFFWSVARVHDRMLAEKKRLDVASEARLSELMRRNLLDADEHVGLGVLRPLIYFHVRHRPIAVMRVYPYDGKTILQLAASALVPLIVVILDIYFRSGTSWQ